MRLESKVGDSKSQKSWTNQNYRLSHAERLCYSHEFLGQGKSL